MDFQKNDIHKRELVGDEIYVNVIKFAVVYGVVSVTIISQCF